MITGFSYEQAVRPYKVEDPQLASAAQRRRHHPDHDERGQVPAGRLDRRRPGHDGIEIRQIVSIDATQKQLTLEPGARQRDHAAEWAGTEFVQYRWYPDVNLDNIFFHDHVDGIHTWAHGLVGQLITEPTGSRYFDPVSGLPIRAGARCRHPHRSHLRPDADPPGRHPARPTSAR